MLRERSRPGVTVPFLGPALALISVILLTAALHFAQAVLMPIALAILLAFLLTPLVKALERRRLRTVVAVTLVTVFAFTVLGMLGWILGAQLASVAQDLPHYRSNIIGKITDLRGVKK